MRKEPTFGSEPRKRATEDPVAEDVVDDRVDEEFLHEIPDEGPTGEIVVKPGRFGPTIARAKTFFGQVKRYERILSALAMVAGFVTDNLMFRRIDLPNTQAIFGAYLGVAAMSILGLHFLERRAREGKMYARWRAFFPMATQFALGGLWSAFLVFYSRSAVVTKSWPYLALLTAFFIGNEVLKRYHSRLVFTTTLFFFAIFTCAIVTVPVYTHTIGNLTFLASGLVAVLALIFFLYILAAVNHPQFEAARGKIALGVAGVYVLMNVFYFTNTLPPLPIALVGVGVYHSVKKTGEVYQAVGETAPWYTEFGFPPTLHVEPGQPLYAYSAVFAPIKLSTKVIHRWRRYDPRTGHWITLSSVTFPINGGRDGGYRGYTIKHNIEPGDWRVDIDTVDNHLIGRITFKVDRVDTAPATVPQTLK
jgi:hypothetical protein